MKIDSISLRKFRNFEKENMIFHPKTTVLIGDNGQGKTNLLESIYFLTMGRSFRVKDDKDLILHGYDTSKITGVFIEKEVKNVITAVIHPQGKALFLNNNAITSIKSYIGQVNTVLFSPVDMTFFDGLPKLRRKFLDSEGSKCSQQFVAALFNFNRIHKERNFYLKSEKKDITYLDTLDQQISLYQQEILKFRKEFIDYLNETVSGFYQQLSNEEATISIMYKTLFDLNEIGNVNHILGVFQESRERDLLYRTTHVGVHRDDLETFFDGYPIENYASQGQKRLVIIAIKLSLIQYIKKVKQSTPILLLDDVFSELDEKKREKFITMLPSDIQTIITTTDLNDIGVLQSNDMIVYTIKDGHAYKGV